MHPPSSNPQTLGYTGKNHLHMCVCKELQLFNTCMSLHLHLQFSMSANTKLKHMHMTFTLNCFCNLYRTNINKHSLTPTDNENSSHRQPRHSYLSVLSSDNITSLQHFQTSVICITTTVLTRTAATMPAPRRTPNGIHFVNG